MSINKGTSRQSCFRKLKAIPHPIHPWIHLQPKIWRKKNKVVLLVLSLCLIQSCIQVILRVNACRVYTPGISCLFCYFSNKGFHQQQNFYWRTRRRFHAIPRRLLTCSAWATSRGWWVHRNLALENWLQYHKLRIKVICRCWSYFVFLERKIKLEKAHISCQTRRIQSFQHLLRRSSTLENFLQITSFGIVFEKNRDTAHSTNTEPITFTLP